MLEQAWFAHGCSFPDYSTYSQTSFARFRWTQLPLRASCKGHLDYSGLVRRTVPRCACQAAFTTGRSFAHATHATHAAHAALAESA